MVLAAGCVLKFLLRHGNVSLEGRCAVLVDAVGARGAVGRGSAVSGGHDAVGNGTRREVSEALSAGAAVAVVPADAVSGARVLAAALERTLLGLGAEGVSGERVQEGHVVVGARGHRASEESGGCCNACALLESRCALGSHAAGAVGSVRVHAAVSRG